MHSVTRSTASCASTVTKSAASTGRASARIETPTPAHHSCRHSVAVTVLALLLLTVAAPAALSGCSQYVDPDVPEPIRPFVEPVSGADYLLYRPSTYEAEYAWPLVVVCHGALADSPNKRIREWTELSEAYGFLVAAPSLTPVGTTFLTGDDKRRASIRENELRVLGTIRHVQAGQRISEDRIFLQGHGEGAIIALYAGLRNPDVVRAIALDQPRFDERVLPDVSAVDRHQPIRVHYSLSDAITGSQGKRCTEWLQQRGTALEVHTHGSAHTADTAGCITFFEEVLREHPWMHMRAFPAAGGNPLDIQFKLACSFKPDRYEWEFGDGETSLVAEPVHSYANAGTYTVTVTATRNQTERRRTYSLTVPDATLSAAQ